MRRLQIKFEIINPATVLAATAYSHAARMGDLIFVSGQVSQDVNGEIIGKEDIRLQTEQVYRNLQAVLNAAGSELDLVGKSTVLTTSLDFRPLIGEVRDRVFESIVHVPPSAFMVVSSLAQPDYLVEIEAVAAVR